MARDWANENPDAPDWPLCPRCRLVTSYDEDTGLCYRCYRAKTCQHDGGLTNPTPAEKSGGRVLRWTYTCVACGATVVIDVGEDASERSRNVFKHGSNIPPSAA